MVIFVFLLVISSMSYASSSPEQIGKFTIFTSEYEARRNGFYPHMIDVANYQHKDRPRGYDCDDIDSQNYQSKDELDSSDPDVNTMASDQSKDRLDASSVNISVGGSDQPNTGQDVSRGNKFYLHNPYSMTTTTIYFLKK